MKLINQKLKSNAGVSFLIALLAFLIAAMVAAVVIAASVSALKAVSDDRSQTETHLALVSAAQLVEEQMDEKNAADTAKTLCTITEKKQGTEVISGPDYTAEGAFKKEMLQVVKQVWSGGLSYNLDNAFSIDADLEGVTEAGGTESVQVSISAHKDTGDDMDDTNDSLIVAFRFQMEGTDDMVYLQMAATPGAPVSSSVTSGTKTTVTNVTEFQWVSRGITGQEDDLE